MCLLVDPSNSLWCLICFRDHLVLVHFTLWAGILMMNSAEAERRQSKYSKYRYISESFSHRVRQLIILVCHSAVHKRTQRQVFSLSAVGDVLHQWDWQSAFPWWHWSTCCVWMKEKSWYTNTLISFHFVFMWCCLSFPHKLQHTHMHLQNNTHANMSLIASNSQHVHAFLVSCCWRGV